MAKRGKHGKFSIIEDLQPEVSRVSGVHHMGHPKFDEVELRSRKR